MIKFYNVLKFFGKVKILKAPAGFDLHIHTIHSKPSYPLHYAIQ